VDVPRLSEALGVPVVTSIAVRKGGTAELLRQTDEIAAQAQPPLAQNLWHYGWPRPSGGLQRRLRRSAYSRR
jgi:Fe2+ transport system protein B